MSHIDDFNARLARFKKAGPVGVFAPTPIVDIEERHRQGLPIIQPALYRPGYLMVHPAARHATAQSLERLGKAARTVYVGPGGVALLHVPVHNIPALALDLELDRRGEPCQSSETLRASDDPMAYGSDRTDADIRKALDDFRSDDLPLVGPSHIFWPTPACGLGPGGEPEPVPAPTAPGGSAGEGVRIVVIDSGIFEERGAQPWLQDDVHIRDIGDIEPPDSPTDDDTDIDYVAGHGHFVAGVIRCQAPKATLFVQRLLHDGHVINEQSLAIALIEALCVRPHLINLSLAGQTWHGKSPLSLDPVFDRIGAQTPEIVVVASAGNAGINTEFWPAARDDVVGVGAICEKTGGMLEGEENFSNYGDWVDVFAPGVEVVNAYTVGHLNYELGRFKTEHPGGVTFSEPFCSWSGTSFAAPYVTGKIAARMTGGIPAAVARDLVLLEAQAVLALQLQTETIERLQATLKGVAAPPPIAPRDPDGRPIAIVI